MVAQKRQVEIKVDIYNNGYNVRMYGNTRKLMSRGGGSFLDKDSPAKRLDCMVRDIKGQHTPWFLKRQKRKIEDYEFNISVEAHYGSLMSCPRE